MARRKIIRVSPNWLCGASVAALALAAGPALAQGAPSSEVVIVAQAVHVAPSAAPTDVIEPTSAIQQEFIQNNIIPLASFDDIVKFAPSVFDQSPNGPGLGKSETLAIRGFQDGQFNVTFDGIPFGDTTDLHHTSSADFIAHDIGQAVIDRGPGTASTVGNATFGGQMGFNTKAPLNSLTINPYATLGSFDTYAGGLEVDSGATPVGKLFLDGQYETSDGYLTHATEQRENYMFKDVYDAVPNLTVTLVSSVNRAFEYTTQGTTLANIAAFGPNYGLGSNPNTQNYYKYQPSNYTSDFEYIRTDYKINDIWRLDNTIYTDSFEHRYTESKDASDTNPADNGVTFYSPTKIGSKLSPQPAGAASDIPGKDVDAYFRDYGDILRLVGDLPFGQVKAGVWYEQNKDNRFQLSTDLTHGNEPVTGKYGTAYSYKFNDTSTTIQPYAEIDWKISPDLTLTPGVRYDSFQRALNGPLNKTTPPSPTSSSERYTALLPSIAARYAIMPGWSAYAQAAEGFLAPPINLLEIAGAPQSVKPENTWNYQGGVDYKKGRWIVGADAYYIDFSNFITSNSIGGQTVYYNGGGAIYEGVELEAQYVLDHGFSLYSNATYNSAKYKGTNVWLAEAPQSTGAAGILYDNRHGPYFSVIGKFIGPRFGLDTPASGVGHQDQYGLDGYWTADLAAGWHFRRLTQFMKDVTVSVKVSNLFNDTQIDDYAGTQSATPAALYWTVAGRSAFVNLSASF